MVIVPIYKTDEQLRYDKERLEVDKDLESKEISVKFDNRDTYKPGCKFAEYELKGVPLE